MKFFDSSQTSFRFGVAQQGDVHQARQRCGSSAAPVEAISNCAVVPSSEIALLDETAASRSAIAIACDRPRLRLFAASAETCWPRPPVRAGSVVATPFAAPTFEKDIVHCGRPQVSRRFASCHRLHHLQPDRLRRVAGRVPTTHALQHRQVRSGRVGHRGHVHVVQGAACLQFNCRGSAIEP